MVGRHIVMHVIKEGMTMKNKFRGFTLIECIVALTILAIASITMAQIYARVSVRNKMNNLVNTSLSNQMAYVEKAIGGDAVEIAYAGSTSTTTPPHKGSPSPLYMQVAKIDPVTGNVATDKGVYSYPVDIYVLYSRDRQGNQLNVSGDAGYTEKDYNLRYKYLLGHSS